MVIHVNVEVTDDKEFTRLRCCCSAVEERSEFVQKGRERFGKRGG